MNPKDIAEKTIKYIELPYNIPYEYITLARAYLELEKKYNNLKLAHDIQSEVMSTYDDTLPYKLQIEITKLKEENLKLKEENENLAHELETTTLEHESVYKMNKQYVENSKLKINQLREENLKLEEENEDLNFYKKQYQSIAGKANLKHLVESNEALRAENEALRTENENLREALAQETFESEKLKAKVERRRKYIKEEIKASINMVTPKARSVYLNQLSASIHQTNVEAGWWTNLETGEPLERNVGELLCLVHSEISEALEAYRKDLMDDKLPHRTGFEVELVDALIRIFDIAGKFKLDLDGALEDKLEYNAKRADHKLENRLGKNGKKF